MSEELIVDNTNETVVVVEGGPTLTTTVDQETVTIVTEYADPVIIDLNAGPRGEPGAVILTGPYPPSGTVGVMGDMYIVTEGSVLVGQVFKKTAPNSWTDVGNVRGPAGGVNTVNGYTGPDVVLNKADIGLGNVANLLQVDLINPQTIDGTKTFTLAPVVPDNSFSIAKVSGLQADLNTRAVDTTVVHLAGNETITGNKTFTGTNTFGVLGVTSLMINPSADHGYITFRSRDATPTTRTAWIGVGSAASTNFTVMNEMTNGSINLTPNGTGSVVVNSGNFTVSSGVITGNGSGITTLNGSNISSGTVADARLSTNVALLTGTQTFSGQKTFTATDTYVARIRGNANAPVYTMADRSLGSVAGNVTITRQHTNSGGTNQFHIVDMVHRSAAGSDWVTAQHYQGIGIDASFLDSPTTGANPLRVWMMRDTNSQTIAFGSGASTYLTLTSSAITVGGSVVFTGNGSGLTTLNASNITSGTLADARLSANIATKAYVDAIVDAAPGTLDTLNELAAALGDDPNFATTMTNQLATKVSLTGNQTISGVKTFTGEANAGTDGYAAPIVINNANPRIGFHDPGVVAGQLVMRDNGDFAFRNMADSAWMVLRAGQIYDNDSRVYSASNPPTIANVTNLTTTLAGKVGTTGNETIAGTKTFTSAPTVPGMLSTGDININQSMVNIRMPNSGSWARGLTLQDFGATTVGGVGMYGSAATMTHIYLSHGASPWEATLGLKILPTGAATFSHGVTAASFTGSGTGLTNLNAVNLINTVAQARLVPNVSRIEHLGVASTARPTGVTYVDWIGSTTPTNMAQGDTFLNTAANGNNPELTPSGIMQVTAQASSTAPSGWYFCEGQQILISGDTSLYNVITNNGTVFPYGGNTNGSGAAGSTHFRLPDMRGRVVTHLDGSTEWPSIGIVFGTKTVTLSSSQSGVPAHNHGVNDPQHSHPLYNRSWGWAASIEGTGDVYIDSDAYTGHPPGNRLGSGGQHSYTKAAYTGITIQNNTAQNAASAHNNVQPTIALRYIIKR